MATESSVSRTQRFLNFLLYLKRHPGPESDSMMIEAEYRYDKGEPMLLSQASFDQLFDDVSRPKKEE